MKKLYTEKIIYKSFSAVTEILRTSILHNGFLILNEVNTGEMMQSHGFQTGEIRQFLFFHPQFMQIILEEDPSAIIKAPLNFVVKQVEEEETLLVYYKPEDLFEDSPGLRNLATILEQRMFNIVMDLIK